MTLFIASLLIYHFGMSGWWYVAAFVIWLARAFLVLRYKNEAWGILFSEFEKARAVHRT
jgi:hypothetical protein